MNWTLRVKRLVRAFLNIRWSAICIALFISVSAYAETFEAGWAAYLAKDYEKAFRTLMPLAEEGHPRAQVTVGLMYDYGQGIPKDSTRAIEWYTKAATQGLPIIQHELGVKYFYGQGIGQDYEKAAKWWHLAASMGHPESQYNLGALYSLGLGVEKDESKAMNWYRMAAEHGHSLAQYRMGVMYASGKGDLSGKSVNVNFADAAGWFQKAAERGVPEAQYNLGVLLEHGQGIAKNPGEAIHLYHLAAEHGLEQACRKLAKVEERGEWPILPRSAPPTACVIKGAQWLYVQDPGHYTIQIFSVSNEQAMIKFLEHQTMGPDVAYFKHRHDGKIYFTAIYGVFDSEKNAHQARLKLPFSLKKSKPWIRKFSDLQAFHYPVP